MFIKDFDMGTLTGRMSYPLQSNFMLALPMASLAGAHAIHNNPSDLRLTLGPRLSVCIMAIISRFIYLQANYGTT